MLAMTSHYEQTSPVLRGAWVLETLLGTPVPPPPPECRRSRRRTRMRPGLSTRQRVLQHRDDPACSACHKLMDPIGFGLENFDWMGRWRDKDKDGQPDRRVRRAAFRREVQRPAGTAAGAAEAEGRFLRQLTGKVLGYALGRSLQDGDSCTVQRLVDTVAQGRLSRADVDSRSRAERAVPEHPGRARSR